MSMHDAIAIPEGGYGVLLTYCGNEGGIKGVLAESEEQTCLSDPAVSNEEQLEEVIVRFCHLKKLQTQRFRYLYPCLEKPPFPRALSRLWQTGSRPVPIAVTSTFALHYGYGSFYMSISYSSSL